MPILYITDVFINVVANVSQIQAGEFPDELPTKSDFSKS